MDNFDVKTGPMDDGTRNKNESGSELTNDPKELNRKPSDGLTDWEREPSIADLKGDLEYARQENIDQANNVDGWLALRDATGKESGVKTKTPGRSTVQPKLIRKHNEWRYPALSEPFLNTDRMYEVKPRTFEDKDAADQNQTLLNWQFDTKINKVSFIDRYVRTVVDEGTCILRVGWERKTEKVKKTRPIYEYYPTESEEHIKMLVEATKLYVDEDPQYEALPDDLKASVEYGAEHQVAVIAQETGEEEYYEDTITMNQPSIKIVDVRNFFVDPSCEGNWEDAQYMIHTYESTKSDLKSRKIYKNLDKVSWENNRIKASSGDPDHTSQSPDADPRVNTDKQKVLVYEYWGLYDVHNNGVMTPIVVTWIGDTIIQMTENPFPDRKPPFVIVPYMPILKSVFGEADASLLQDNQRILGAIIRGMIDLLGRSANAQTGYAKGFLDPVNRRRFVSGEDFEFNPNGDPRQQIQQMTYPEIPKSALQMSQIQNAEAEGLSGVKSFTGGITGEAYGRVARGITGAMDAAGQREMGILRRLAEGIKLVGVKIVSMNAHFLEEKEVIRVTNKEFVEIKREDLAGNFDLKVDISSQGADEAKSQDLGMMLQTMGPDMDPGLSQMILGEIADLKRMPHLAERIRSYQPQPDPLEQKRKELELRKIEVDVMLDEARARLAMAQAEHTRLDTELEATGVRHDRNVEQQGAQARGNRDLEVTKSLLKGDSNPKHIEAAVGFNELTERKDERQGNGGGQFPVPVSQEQPAFPPANMAPLRSTQPLPNAQPVALPQ